jgi:hypothetical protein
MERQIRGNKYHEAPVKVAKRAYYHQEVLPNLMLEAWIYPTLMLQEIDTQKNLQDAGKMKKYLEDLSIEDIERHFQQIIERNLSHPDNLRRPYFF